MARPPAPRAHRLRRAVAAGLVAVLALGAGGCAGRLGRNDTERVPGEPNPARGNVPPDGHGG